MASFVIVRRKSGGSAIASDVTRRRDDDPCQRWRAASARRGEVYKGPLSNRNKGAAMNWDRAQGNWKQLKGKVKEQWGKLTDDDLDRIAGKRDQLAGKIQNTYGIGKDEAEKQIKDWESSQKDLDS